MPDTKDFSLETSLRRAAAFHRNNRLADAEALYLLILKDEPDHYDALYGLGHILGSRNCTEEALARFHAAATCDPSSAIAWNEVGRCLVKLNRLQDAVAAFEQVRAIQPDHANIHYNLGNVFQVMERNAEAIASYEAALALQPGHPETHSNLGCALQNVGRLEDAIAHLRKARALAPNFADAAYNLGNALWSSGRLQDAIVAYEQAISIKPELFEAHYNLGNILQSIGMLSEAVASLKTAIGLRPEFGAAHSSLGNILMALKRHDEALPHLATAVAVNPDDVKAHCTFGNLLFDTGHPKEALAQYEVALAHQPDYAEACYNIANCLQALGRHTEAIAHYSKAIALKPDYAEAYNNYGGALQADDRIAEAIEQYETALALNPRYAEARYNYGLALQKINRDADAITQYRHAIALNPEYAQPHNNLGNLLHVLGRRQEALNAFEKAIAVDPQPRFYRNMAEAKHFAADDPYFAAMVRMAENPLAISDDSRTDLYFALGKACDDMGQYDRAFAYFRDGNALKRRDIVYDEAAALALFARIASVFSRQLMRDQASSGYASSIPVFVLGMPRSGTSLVEQVLASHPAVHGAGELDSFATEAARRAGRTSPSITDESFLDVIRAQASAELRGLGQRYLQAVQPLAPTKHRIVDKQTSNFMHVGLIHLALPQARIVHVRRDPIDTCLSCFSKLFTHKQYFSYHLGELGRYYRAYEKLMDHWRDVLPAGAMFEVQYEDFVADFDGQAKRLIAYCGLDWDPSCLDFHTTERPVRTASAGQVRKPLYRTSVGRSRFYAKHLEPLLDALGLDGMPEMEHSLR